MSPIPHEVQAKTGHALRNPGLAGTTLDVSGNVATNGQYLFPFGMGLGGIAFPEMVEINLDALGTPLSFTGLPWLLDRRLSPAGCIDTDSDGDVDCEPTPQPIDPFPFEGIDPRTLAAVPQGPYNDPNFTSQPLTRTANRILSFVDANGKFQGDASVLAWPPSDPLFGTIPVTPEVALVCSAASAGTQFPPVASPDSATTPINTPATIAVLTNDSDANGDPLSVIAVTPGANGTTTMNGVFVTYTPAATFAGVDTFNYTVADGRGGTASATVTVNVGSAPSVTVALFEAATATWRVSGTAAVGATITIHLGDTLDGDVVGTTVVPDGGVWTFLQAGSAVVPDATQRISVESTGGGALLAVPVTVR
jgi:hypothetical protein